jgi:hypothetical protein
MSKDIEIMIIATIQLVKKGYRSNISIIYQKNDIHINRIDKLYN